ncbi:hypothetical protein R3P38DRAFT_2517348 [Favolaschia claudopus]|uniref:SnoaL-like domain-containing protein n=1 Tax=Favolaschia claudopus TaxID=2862362 RepID=A0AAW0C995_9AGAR
MADFPSLAAQSPIDVGIALLDAITANDAKSMEVLMDDDFIWRLCPTALGVREKNKRQYLLQSAELSRIFASLEVHLRTPINIVQSEKAVAVQVLCEGELATGAPHHAECVMIFECRDGRVTRMTEFHDSEAIRKALDAGDGAGWKLLDKEWEE